MKTLTLFNHIILICFLIAAVNNLLFAETKKSYKPMKAIKPIAIELANEAAVVLDGKKITIGEAIRLAIEKNHDIISGKYDVAMADSMNEKFQKKYSPFLSLDGGSKYQKNTGTAALFEGEKKTSLDASAAIAKMFSTGTTVSAGIKHEYAKRTTQDMAFPVFSDPNDPASYLGSTPSISFSAAEYHRPIIFAGIKQELLKNSFGYSEKRQRKILKNAGQMKRDAIISYLSILVVGVIADYWNLVYMSAALDNAELQLQETKTVRSIIAQNVRLGLSEKFTLNFYNVLVNAAEAKKTNAKQGRKDSLRKFLQVVNLGKNVNITDKAVFSNVLYNVNVDKAIQTAFKKRTDYRNAVANLEIAKLNLEINENDALPSLTAEFYMYSMAEQDQYLKAYSDVSTMAYPSLEARIKMTYPLDDSEQKINVRNSHFKLKQANIQLSKTKRAVKDDIISKSEHIKTFYNIYRKTRSARMESKKYYRSLLLSLKRGRFSAAVVKNGLDALIESRQNELGAIVRYNVALLEFEVAKNELFYKYNINVDKYIPKK